jgi:hypothetical protein
VLGYKSAGAERTERRKAKKVCTAREPTPKPLVKDNPREMVLMLSNGPQETRTGIDRLNAGPVSGLDEAEKALCPVRTPRICFGASVSLFGD